MKMYNNYEMNHDRCAEISLEIFYAMHILRRVLFSAAVYEFEV